MGSILAIDQGTTSSRAIVFDSDLKPKSSGQEEFTQIFPASGWVEHNPSEIYSSTINSAKSAMVKTDSEKVAAIGITNQRETVLVWDKSTGETLGNAIVWQDRRTSSFCESLRKDGHEPLVCDKTGLLLDPYFSASKLSWILDKADGARQRAYNGELLFGTVDSFLIWKLTGGKSHVTDATNASRTMLFNIATNDWDDDLLSIFDIPRCMLPKVRDCSAEFGDTDPAVFGRSIPIRGVAGDQQAATVGQACFFPGMLKSTYGTGCFALLNTGKDKVTSGNRLLTTIAYRLDGATTYALEGSIFIAGAVVQWLRDGLKIIDSASETQALAELADLGQKLYLVPAFTGLGAPYWDAECRGALFGLTRSSGPAELARAALESVAFQSRDLIEAMKTDWPEMEAVVLRVDGGMTASDWTMQALADQLDSPVDRPVITETTALGAAYLAGLKSGICPPPEEFSKSWALERRFEPCISKSVRDGGYAGWKDAVKRTLVSKS
ncbi:MAG: glycerol kinase GlpK [Albidovulum sp.]|nr:glycerol kinase GlpK [Albidovulum sp.]MDE0530317.1 glycerol kinase GlpK [Albidovulum sp.]